MWICLCKGVSDRQIREAIRRGARTLEDLARETRVATDCGTCAGLVLDLLREELSRSEPARPRDGWDERT